MKYIIQSEAILHCVIGLKGIRQQKVKIRSHSPFMASKKIFLPPSHACVFVWYEIIEEWGFHLYFNSIISDVELLRDKRHSLVSQIFL